MESGRRIGWTLAGVVLGAGIAIFLRQGPVPAQVQPAPVVPAPTAPAEPLALPGAPELAAAPPPAAEERREAEPGPRGRVVASGTGEPLPGITVRLGSAFDTLSETVTGPDGAFQLPRPDKARRTVQVVADGWRSEPRSVRLDEEQSAGTTELLFELERIVAAPLRGRLVDRATGEPIPFFLFEARGPVRKRSKDADADQGEAPVSVQVRSPPRRSEEITSDEQGRFASAGGFESGLLELVLHDHPAFEQVNRVPTDDWTVEHEHAFHDPEAPEAEVKLLIGPTYRFQLAFPAGLGAADFHAVFPRAPPGNRELHRMTSEDPQSPFSQFLGSAASGAGSEERAPLRDDAAPWVRFRGPVLFLPVQPDVARSLHVRSADGYWSGSATVTSVQGIHPELVAIELAAQGSIEVAAVDADGDPVRAAWLELRPRGQAEPVRSVGVDAKGRFAFRWLDPGDYELSALTDRYDPWSTDVAVHSGATETVEARLTSSTPLGSISGVLRGRTGRHRLGGGMVLLKSVDDPSFFLMQTATLRKRDGGYAALFTFKDLPVGSYELALRPLDNMRWEPLSMVVSAPAEGLEFLCADDAALFDLGFRAFDAVTGEALAEVHSIVWHADPLHDARLDDDWESKLYKNIPEGAPLRWAVRVAGYQVAEGDETALLVEEAQRTIEARLTPGFGQLFNVTTREREPLAGVELLVDGAPAGVTDARGLVLLNRSSPPSALEFRLPGWHVSWGTVDPKDPKFARGLETPVYLTRDE